MLAGALFGYLQEIENYKNICQRHEATTAVHARGKTLQVYRMFPRDEATARQIRRCTDEMPSWEESPFWKSHQQVWKRNLQQIESRMAKHEKQVAIATRGIDWRGTALIVHAYKFEPDPMMKVELVVPPTNVPTSELPLQIMAAILECHENIVPSYIATPLAPYVRHETQFLSIMDYLLHAMPETSYAASCLQRVSRHASDGVGSRDPLREHLLAASFPLPSCQKEKV